MALKAGAALTTGLKVASAVGTAANVYGALREGAAAKAAGQYNQGVAEREARQLDVQAGQEVAVATHNSSRIQGRLKELLAEQRAAAASGGGSTQDASVMALRGEALKTASLDDLLNMADAEERSQQIRHSAEVTRAGGRMAAYEGKQASKASKLRAADIGIQGAVSWYDRFGGAKPKSGGGNNRTPV